MFDIQKLSIAALCHGNLDQKLWFEIWNYKENGSHTYYSEFLATINEVDSSPVR